MNIVVINFSGNVGKSTLCKYLLLPRTNGVVFSVESINGNDFDDVDTLQGEQFKKLLNAVDNEENAIIDVGSSNAEDFFEQMQSFEESYSLFDFFIIPVTPVLKQQDDTVSTIKSLLNLGVKKENLLVVFNMIGRIETIEEQFSILNNFHLQNNAFDFNPNLAIKENEFYALNKGTGKTIEEIVNDDRDFKELIRISRKNNPGLVNELSHDRAVQMLARGIKRELDEVFYELFGTNQIGFDDE
jgi:hypothetical protein